MKYNITSAKYYEIEGIDNHQIKVQLDNSDLWTFFPNVTENDLYAEIMRQVEAGTLTIQEAE